MVHVRIDDMAPFDADWRTAADAGQLELRIQLPHNDNFEHVVTAPEWIALLRILVPGVAFAAVYYALKQYLGLRKRLRSLQQLPRKQLFLLGMTVCALDGPACFIVGVLYAAGMHGQYELPMVRTAFKPTEFVTTSA
jgi:hypothetical protein